MRSCTTASLPSRRHRAIWNRPVARRNAPGKRVEGTRPAIFRGVDKASKHRNCLGEFCRRGCVGWRRRNPVTCRNALENGRRERAPAIFRGVDKNCNTGIALVNLPSRMRGVVRTNSVARRNAPGKRAQSERAPVICRSADEARKHRNYLGQFAIEDAWGGAEEIPSLVAMLWKMGGGTHPGNLPECG